MVQTNQTGIGLEPSLGLDWEFAVKAFTTGSEKIIIQAQ
jgi:hypothetical protein